MRTSSWRHQTMRRKHLSCLLIARFIKINAEARRSAPSWIPSGERIWYKVFTRAFLFAPMIASALQVWTRMLPPCVVSFPEHRCALLSKTDTGRKHASCNETGGRGCSEAEPPIAREFTPLPDLSLPRVVRNTSCEIESLVRSEKRLHEAKSMDGATLKGHYGSEYRSSVQPRTSHRDHDFEPPGP